MDIYFPFNWISLDNFWYCLRYLCFDSAEMNEYLLCYRSTCRHRTKRELPSLQFWSDNGQLLNLIHAHAERYSTLGCFLFFSPFTRRTFPPFWPWTMDRKLTFFVWRGFMPIQLHKKTLRFFLCRLFKYGLLFANRQKFCGKIILLQLNDMNYVQAWRWLSIFMVPFKQSSIMDTHKKMAHRNAHRRERRAA